MGIKVLALFVTERCQYSCEYCDIPTISEPKDYDIGIFSRYIDIINDYPLDMVTITGGEPGLLPEFKIKYLFNRIKHQISVNTNGLFIDRGYYDRWKHKIQTLDYHYVHELNGHGKLHDIDTSERFGWPKGRYILVSHAKNQGWIQWMLHKYPHIDWCVRPYDDKLDDPSFQNLEKNDFSGKICYNAIKEIDLVNGKLIDCCKSPISSPKRELNRVNLKKFLDSNESRRWHACSHCEWWSNV